MKIVISLLFFCLSGCTLFSQCDTSRYREPIFESVYKHENVKYGEAPVWTVPYNNTELFMDIYEPIGDDLTKRPLMIWMHPGGFLIGTKEAQDIVALCDSFARRGYVTASLGYRLGFNPLSESSAERAVYRGTQDARAAIRYLMEFADLFDIDTNYIFLGGSSAGGVATVHVAYADQDEVPESIEGGTFSNDLGCLDCAGNSYAHEINLSGIVNMWGAIGDSIWVDSDETTPALLIHGVEDAVVPFGVGHPFGVFTTPLTHGSRCIHNQLEMHGIDHEFLPFPGQDHEPHGTSNGDFESEPTPYWDTIFNAIREHYFEQLKPEVCAIAGMDSVCLNQSTWYSVDCAENVEVCWEVQNGEIVEWTEDSVLVKWLDHHGRIEARFQNQVEAVSDKFSRTITVRELPNSDFSYSVDGATVNFVLSNEQTSGIDWNFGDEHIDEGSSVAHVYALSGNYPVSVRVIGTNGCVSEGVKIVNVTEGEVYFEMYPNPAFSVLNLSKLPKGSKVIVSDIYGKRVAKIKDASTEEVIDLSNYQAGVYFVTVKYEGGRLMKRFLKN